MARRVAVMNRSSRLQRSFALAVTAQPRSLFHSGRLCIRRGSKAARADKPPCKSNRPALTVRRRADVSAALDLASVCQRIGANLDVHRERACALAKLVEPGRAVAAGTPQAPAFPAGIRIVDAPVQTFSVETHRVWHPHQDHLPVLEADEPVLEVGGRDRNVLAEPRRIVVVDPGVVARLGAGVLKNFEARPRILVVREALGAVIPGRVWPVERALALAPVEADQSAVRARGPQHPVLVDVAAAQADALLWNGIELAELGLGIEAQEARWSGEHIDRIPDGAIGGVRHHGVRTRARDAHVLARLPRLARLGVFVDLAIAVGVKHERRPALRLRRVASLVEYAGVDPAGDRPAPADPQRVVGLVAELEMMR